MSRIGNKIITLPAGVEFTQDNGVVTVKGPKGELTREFPTAIEIRVEGTEVTLHRPNDSKEMKTIHGTSRANLNNMVVGVSEGYKKTLELVGVGYRVSNQGQVLEFALGYTHNIFLSLPDVIKIETKSERNQNPVLILECCDKQLIGQVCAKIRSFRKPEPYKGKGVKFAGEVLRRKAGKSAGK